MTSEPVRILRIAAGGDGVGRLQDGRAVFVPRSAPGDLIQLGRHRSHGRFVRARIGTILEPGAGRVEPRCTHYLREDCGGCQFQHLDLATQLEAKRAIVADALERIGHLTAVVPPVIAGSQAWGYRNRITLAVGHARRFAGFHPLDEAGRVFALEYCHLASPPLMELWSALRPRLHLLPPDAEQLVLRIDRERGRHLVVKARGAQAWGRPGRLAETLVAAGAPTTIWWQPGRGAPRVVAGHPEAFPATVFEQVNPALGDRLRAWSVDRLQIGPGDHVWDLYAGIGETTELMLRRGATVESVELARRAVELAAGREPRAAGRGAESQQPGPSAVQRYVGAVEDLMDRLRSPRAVLANPPRAGLSDRVRARLLVRRPERLVYVSCDPATLARDLGHLAGTSTAGAYRLTAVQPFDLFPETAHVETVAVLEA